MIPQGRLTHQSGTPVQTSEFAGSVLYYTPYVGDFIPIYDGTTMNDCTFSQLTHALDGDSIHTGYLQNGHVYDEFVTVSDGVMYLGNGPSWSSITVRGTGSGSSELEFFSHTRVNKYAITLRFGSGSGDTVSVPARQATYVGTVYASDNGLVKFQMKPSMGSGGSANVLGYWNAYNRVRIKAICQNSDGDWSYDSTTPRYAGGNTRFRITWVDGLAQSLVEAEYQSSTSCTGVANGALTVATMLDAPSPFTGTFDGMLAQGATTLPTIGMEVTGKNFTPPLLGVHYYQAMEESTPVAVTVYSERWSTLMVTLEM